MIHFQNHHKSKEHQPKQKVKKKKRKKIISHSESLCIFYGCLVLPRNLRYLDEEEHHIFKESFE